MELKNGAKVHAYFQHGHYRYVIAKHLSSWVVWAVDSQGYCSWGHYFNSRCDANQDFFNRCKKASTFEL